MDLLLLILTLAVGLVGLVLAAVLGGEGRGWWIAALAVIACSALGRLAGHGIAGLGLAAAAEIAALGLVLAGRDAGARIAARTWATALVPAIVAVAAAFLLVDLGHHRPAAPWDGIAVGLFVLGFALKLGLVPLYFWLPVVARSASATSLVLIFGIVDAGVVADLAALRDLAPWVFTDHTGLWASLAVLSLLGAALLAVAETDLKAIVAFAGVVDAGFLLLGLLPADDVARTGVTLGLLGHALAVTAIYGAVACGETALGRPLSIADVRGLANRLPVASGVFMVGAAALVGLPPSLAFAAHWRLFRAAAEVGGAAMTAVVFVAASLVLLVMVRALHRVWLGPASEEIAWSVPVAARAVLVAVALAVAGTGLVPRLFEPSSPGHQIALAPTLR